MNTQAADIMAERRRYKERTLREIKMFIDAGGCKMTMYDMEDWVLWCEGLTDTQLINCYQREKEAAKESVRLDREVYAFLAREEMRKRGMYEGKGNFDGPGNLRCSGQLDNG